MKIPCEKSFAGKYHVWENKTYTQGLNNRINKTAFRHRDKKRVLRGSIASKTQMKALSNNTAYKS